MVFPITCIYVNLFAETKSETRDLERREFSQIFILFVHFYLLDEVDLKKQNVVNEVVKRSEQ